MKKILCIVLIMFLLTGCSATYSVEINKDFSVNEFTEVIGDERYKTEEGKLSSFFDMISSMNSDYFNKDDKSTIKPYINSFGNLSATLTKKYNNLEDYVNSFYPKNMYDKGIKLTDDKNIITLENTSYFAKMELFSEGYEEASLIDLINVSIKVPYIVTDHNADVVDEKTNTYTWKYDYSSYYKNFKLSFDKTREFRTGIDIMQILLYIGIGFIILFIGYIIYKNVYAKGIKNNKM